MNNTLADYDIIADSIEVCGSLGIRVTLHDGVLHLVYWTLADLAVELERSSAPVFAFVPPGCCLAKVSPRKKAAWCIEDASRDLWLAEEFLTKILFYSYTDEEQRLLARLITEYQHAAYLGFSHAIYWLQTAGLSPDEIAEYLRVSTRDGIETLGAPPVKA
jgi:hypothetical protein